MATRSWCIRFRQFVTQVTMALSVGPEPVTVQTRRHRCGTTGLSYARENLFLNGDRCTNEASVDSQPLAVSVHDGKMRLAWLTDSQPVYGPSFAPIGDTCTIVASTD